MLKTLLAFSGAVLLSTPLLHAQGVHGRVTPVRPGFANHVGSPLAAHGYAGSYNRGNYHHGGYHRGNWGRYYYFGGIPYFYPFYGYGYPYYGGFYGDFATAGAYNGTFAGRSAEGEQRDGDAQINSGASLPEAVQRQLAKRGYYKGAVDGQFGPQTSSALSRFQKKQGLKETGRIDEPTLEALGFTDRH